MKFIVFCLEFISSLEDMGNFFSSAALVRRLRRPPATLPFFVKGHSRCQFAFLFVGSAHFRGSQSHELSCLIIEELCLLIRAIETDKYFFNLTRYKQNNFHSYLFSRKLLFSVDNERSI